MDIYSASADLIGNANRLRTWLIGQLCIFAECIESNVGLDPLPELADQKELSAATNDME